MRRSLVTAAALALVAMMSVVSKAEAQERIYGNIPFGQIGVPTSIVGYCCGELPDLYHAQGFKLGATPWDITSISLGLANYAYGSPVVGIYSNDGRIDVPDGLLATFTSAFPVASQDVYSFTGSFSALANTTYWVVVSNANSASQNSFDWFSSDPNYAPGEVGASGVTYVGTQERDGETGAWIAALPSLSIDLFGTAASNVTVPEPSTFALTLVAGVLMAGATARQRTKRKG